MKDPGADEPVSARDVVTHFLRREVKSIAANEPLVHEGFDVEGVHQMRVSARRLRSEVQAMRGVLPREPWRDLAHDLKWMGASLGELRDLDVLEALFTLNLDEGSEVRRLVLAKLERRRERARRAVAEMLESPRYARIVKRVGRLANSPQLGDVGGVGATELFLPSLWGASCEYLESIGDPYERRGDDALHQVRIATKRCRYNFEVATVYLGEDARRVGTSLEAVQDILGQVHDRVVAVAFLDMLHVGEEADIEVRRALRAQVATLRPQWPPHFVEARRGIMDVFESGR